MANVIDLTSRIQQLKCNQEQEDQYDDALEVLDDILNLTDGQALFVFNIKGKLRATKVRGSRFEVNPEELV